MTRVIYTLLTLPEEKRVVSHYRKYCADNGVHAEAILKSLDGREYCVCCNSGLNAAGQAIMGGGVHGRLGGVRRK